MNNTSRYEKIDKECPVCGLRGVWYCSARDCPKADDQVEARKIWLDLSTSPPEENPSSN